MLTGPNNTGKTWLAWCIYGLMRRWLPMVFAMPAEHLAETVVELELAEAERIGAGFDQVIDAQSDTGQALYAAIDASREADPTASAAE